MNNRVISLLRSKMPMPPVPSAKYRCVKCKGGTWISKEVVKEIHERHPGEDIDSICVSCYEPSGKTPVLPDAAVREFNEYMDKVHDARNN